jgi:polysaccharide chain length determinant protein (PEP-CTERM system associated)
MTGSEGEDKMVGQRELTLEDYIAIARRRWILIAVLAVLGASLGYGIARYLPKRYTSRTLVLVEAPSVPEKIVTPVVSADTSQRLASMQQEIMSRTRLEPLIQQFRLYPQDVSRVPTEDLVARLRSTIEVTPIQPMAQTRAQGLPGFSISVTFDDPRLAQQICSTVTSMFMEENLQLRQRQAEQTTQFLTKQLEDAKAKLDEQDARLALFQRRHLGALPDDQQSNLNILAGLTSQLDAATQTLSRAQQDKTFAESSLAQVMAAWQASQDSVNPQTREQQISALELELSALKSKYTDDHPDVIKLKRDIAAAKAAAQGSEPATEEDETPSRARIEPAQVQSLRAQIHQIEQVIKERTAQQEELHRRIREYQTRVEASPMVEQEYKGLTRDYQTALEFYNELLKKRDQSAMATDLERRQQSEQFRVLDPANLPDRPSFPNKLLFGIGGLSGGLGLSLVLTLLLEVRDTSLRSDRDVELLLELPVLAVVPKLSPSAAKAKTELAVESAARA